MIKVEWFYWLTGLFFLVVAAQIFRDHSNPKRLTSAAFWGLLGVSFGYGTFVVNGSAPAWLLGIIVIAAAALAGAGLTGPGAVRSTDHEERQAFADRFRNRLFVPALTIPVVAVLFAVGIEHIQLGGTPVLEVGFEALIGLGVGCVAAAVVGIVMLRPPSPVSTTLHEGRRLLEAIGWAALLPQMLATLGLLFTSAGVGDAVGKVVTHVLPSGSLIAAVVLYCVGMAVFTIIMGNAFAAFPVMTAAIGWPILVQQFHGTIPAVFAVGMLAGFCGTLCTPMAANFNLVPAALLEMKDRYGPIKAQLATAGPLLVCNVAIMYFFAF